jgi:hypothetical protein
MSWHEMQIVNDRRCPCAWPRQKAVLNMALAALVTAGAILVGLVFPAAADERPADPFGNHTTELNQAHHGCSLPVRLPPTDPGNRAGVLLCFGLGDIVTQPTVSARGAFSESRHISMSADRGLPFQRLPESGKT